MATHAQLGVQFADGTISGCYVHYDGHTLPERLQDYLKTHTTTHLALLIDRAQRTGGIRAFHCPDVTTGKRVTEFLKDQTPHVIDESRWGWGDHAESYFWLIDYKSGQIITRAE